MANTLKYFGLVGDKVPSTNEIWAFTAGELTNGWDSDKASSLEDLTKRVVDGVNDKKRAVIAVPAHGNQTKDFTNLLVEKQTAAALRIRVFDPHLGAYTRNLILTGVKVGPILPLGHHPDPKVQSAYKLCNLRAEAANWEAP